MTLCVCGLLTADCCATGWWHATLNLDEAVFMSTFVSYAPAPRSAAPLLRRAGPVPFPGDVLAPAQRETELRRQRH